jgi:hypothetical protein
MVSEEITNNMERVFANQYLSSRKTNALLRAKALRDEQLRKLKSVLEAPGSSLCLARPTSIPFPKRPNDPEVTSSFVQ